MADGHAVITGFSVSLTVTVKVQALVLPLVSVAVHVTVALYPLTQVYHSTVRFFGQIFSLERLQPRSGGRV